MTSFSQLVDKMILEVRRPDLASEIRSYVVQTIREVHFEPERNDAILYRNNMKELSLVASVDHGFTWTIPNSTIFQSMQAVRYDSICDIDGEPVYALERVPGRALRDTKYFYYRATDYFAFSHYGATGSGISLAYYEYPRSLKYYAPADRPATYDSEEGWSYKDDITDPDLQAAAREKVTNWLLDRWDMVLEEGIRAKAYKRVADDSRSRTAYSLYAQLRKGLVTSETATGDGIY